MYNLKTLKVLSVINIVLLLPVSLSILSTLPNSLKNQYNFEIRKRTTIACNNELLTENNIVQLPLQIQKYLQYTGVIGKPIVYNFKASMNESFKMKPQSKWLYITAEQSNTYIDRSRLFYIKSSLYGIPFDGFHQYTADSATMKIQIAHTLKVADAKGDAMTRSETVTLLNDMCLFAPATLIDTSIRWEVNSPLSVTAHFYNKGFTVSAQLVFDTTGALVNFISNDRCFSADGKTYKQYTWSTPVRSYQIIEGRRLFSEADAIWQMPDGEFEYAKFFLKKITYNTDNLASK
jgi:hypothetical protein